MRHIDERQAGFAFDDPTEPEFAEDAPGTWLDPEMSAEAFRIYLRDAKAQLAQHGGLLHELFSHALKLASAALLEFDETIEAGKLSFTLPWIDVEPDADQWAAFVAGCINQAWPGAEYRVRKHARNITAALHMPGIGSLRGNQWDGGRAVIDFTAGRDPELLPSYQDEPARHCLPAALWSPCYAGQRLAENSDSPAAVNAVTHQGRQYVITSCLYHGSKSTGHAWAISALEDWHGPTYSYRSQCQAWDDGRKERGDCRGLIVKINGQRCVLAAYAEFYDKHDSACSAAEPVALLEDADGDA